MTHAISKSTRVLAVKKKSILSNYFPDIFYLYSFISNYFPDNFYLYSFYLFSSYDSLVDFGRTNRSWWSLTRVLEKRPFYVVFIILNMKKLFSLLRNLSKFLYPFLYPTNDWLSLWIVLWVLYMADIPKKCAP